jgi:hypothetical protein
MTEANETLEFIYNDDSIIPFALRKEIEYIFIPTEFQIFGKNKYGEKETNIEQFDYYKNNEAHRVKNFESGTYWYWTGSPHISNSTHFCIVNYNGNADYGSASSAYGLAPAFIIKVNNENERED